VVFSDPLVDLLFGAQYHEAGTALLLLAPAMALYPISFVSGLLLVAQDRARTLAIIFAGVAAGNVVLNILLIPGLSLRGAALVTSLSELTLAVFLLACARRAVGPVKLPRLVTGALLASVLAGSTMYLLRDRMAVALAAGLLTYVTALVSYESLAFPDDVAVIKRFIHLGRR
jgi:O-antigen/teichoic acid export membrane protein